MSIRDWRPKGDFVVFEGHPGGHFQGPNMPPHGSYKNYKMPECNFVVFEGSPGGHSQGQNKHPLGTYKNYKNLRRHIQPGPTGRQSALPGAGRRRRAWPRPRLRPCAMGSAGGI